MDKREGNRQFGIKMSDVALVRKRIKIGQRLKYEATEYSRGDEVIVNKKLVPVIVVRKYPHLVEVEPVKRMKGPQVWTIPYTEIAIRERGLR